MKRHLAFATVMAGTLAFCVSALSQNNQELSAFLNRIFNASNSVSAETARAAHKQCVALGQELAALPGFDPLQRLYLEAEIESCISYAMNHGKFVDDNGDECSHQFTFATKIAQVIEGGKDKTGYAGDTMRALGERLERTLSIAPQVGCKQDFAAFTSAIAIAKAQSVPPPPPANRALIDSVGSVRYEITSGNAREMQTKCLSFKEQAAATPELTPVERLYVGSMIEDCVARAKSIGQYADVLGDACSHHFGFAVKLAEGVAAGKLEPEHPDMLHLIMQGELETAKRQGPDMGCKQDYGSLK